MKRILLIVFLFSFFSCNKERNVNPYTFVFVKFIEDEDFIFIETADGNWDSNTKLAQLTATGYNNERFRLSLPSLTDTGNYPAPSITNISFSNGVNFVPFKLNSGFIHVSSIDSLSVRGDFQVSLASDFNGSVNRTIIGNFGINVR